MVDEGLRIFAENHGWDVHIAELYELMLEQRNEVQINQEAWGRIESEETTFALAAFALAKTIHSRSQEPEYTGRRTISTVVSRGEGETTFPLKQYLRELVQNALDVRNHDSPLNIRLRVSDEQLEFEHDGAPFRGPKRGVPAGEMFSLMEIGSTTKKGTFDSTGQFGIGFKGWMLFFDRIEHNHSNGRQTVKIGYHYPGTSIIDTVIQGPNQSQHTDATPFTKFKFSCPRESNIEQFRNISIGDVLEQWLPMIRFIDSEVNIHLDIRGEVLDTGHCATILQEQDDFRILRFNSQEFLNKRYHCAAESCTTWFVPGGESDEWGDEFPECPSCEDNGDVVIRNYRFFCKFENKDYPDCNSFFVPNGEQFNLNEWRPLCPSCETNENVSVHEPQLNDTEMIAIEAPISPTDEITLRINEFIQQESAWSENNNPEQNPWHGVDEQDWYLHKRMRLGFKMDNLEGPQAWLYSLAEIAESSRWIKGQRESLLTDTNWCIDGPFFLHPNRNELDDRTPSSRNANLTMLKMVLSKLVGPLVNYHHQAELQVPLKTPFDNMVLAHLDGTLSTQFGEIVQGDSDTADSHSLIPYHELFGGRPLFENASGELINPNLAKRIPDEWLLPGGENPLSLSEWISNNSDLSGWVNFPAVSHDRTPKLLRISDVPVIAHVEKVNAQDLYQKMQQNGEWAALVAAYPNILSCDWVRIPLPENADTIVGVHDGWPQSLDLVVQKMKEHNVLFSGDEEIQSVFSDPKKIGKWTERRGISYLLVPDDASDVWWLNALLEKAVSKSISLTPEVFDLIESLLEDSDSNFFMADLTYSKPNHPPQALGKALIPYDVPGRSRHEQTYSPSLGLGYSLQQPNSDRTLWSVFPGERFELTNDLDHFIFEEDGGSQEILFNHPYVLLGDPVNPLRVIELYIDLMQRDEVSHHRNSGGFLIANPCTINSDERLKDKNWTKLPSITLSLDPSAYGFIWGELHEYSGRHAWPNTKWNGEWKNSGVTEYVYPHGNTPSLVGSLMKLDRKEQRLKEVIIRRLPIQEIYVHPEFVANHDLEFKKNMLAIRLNEDRFTINSPRTRFAKLFRGGSRSEFYLRVANIQTPLQAMNPNLQSQRQKPNIPLEAFEIFKVRNLCGFSQPDFAETTPWLFHLDPLEEFTDEYHDFDEILTNLDSIVSIRPSDCCGMSETSLEKNTEGLADGFRMLTDAMFQSEELNSKPVIPLAMLFAHIEMHRPQESTKNLFEKHDVSVSSENIPLLLEAVQDKLSDETLPQDITSALRSFREALQNFQGRSWATLIEQWDSDATPEAQWELFRQSNVLPEVRPVFGFQSENQEFRRSPTQASISSRFVYLSMKDARYLFNIDGLDMTYTANRWALNPEKRLFVVDREIKTMISATPLHVPAQLSLPVAEPSDENAQFHPHWAFIQSLLAFKNMQSNGIQLNSVEEFLSHVPSVEAVEDSHPCSIFGHDHVWVGQAGWNIEQNGTQNRWALQTVSPPSGNKATLRLLLIRSGFNMSLLNQASFNSDIGRELLCSRFDFEKGSLDLIIESIKNHPTMQGRPVLNPFGGGPDGKNPESLVWEQEFAVRPEWNHDKQQTIDLGGAMEMLQRYKTALTVLLRRGDLGPADRNEASDQMKLSKFGSIRDVLKRSLYTNTSSMVCDEPILYIPDEGVPNMGNAQRYLHSARRSLLIENAGLRHYLGNQLFLSQYMRHRATMTADAFGLRERPEQTIQASIHSLLHDRETWGDEETVVLRDVMQAGDGNHLSLRVHKYHAICMCALDDALDEIEAE